MSHFVGDGEDLGGGVVDVDGRAEAVALVLLHFQVGRLPFDLLRFFVVVVLLLGHFGVRLLLRRFGLVAAKTVLQGSKVGRVVQQLVGGFDGVQKLGDVQTFGALGLQDEGRRFQKLPRVVQSLQSFPEPRPCRPESAVRLRRQRRRVRGGDRQGTGRKQGRHVVRAKSAVEEADVRHSAAPRLVQHDRFPRVLRRTAAPDAPQHTSRRRPRGRGPDDAAVDPELRRTLFRHCREVIPSPFHVVREEPTPFKARVPSAHLPVLHAHQRRERVVFRLRRPYGRPAAR
mmetsp:Transcript_107/g.273  ORF Transcript_107/g.273 Transcript_107/m.273 type:complete len:286 (+) Transcript_107:1064-1921(+)